MNDLENLLDLDGEIFPMDNGYWVKFEVHKVQKNVAYEFESASQLIEDFWDSVEYYMENN